MTKPFEIVLKKSVLKDIKRIPRRILENIQERIASLATDPIPSGAEPIQGYKDHYRIRIGQYRVVYEVTSTIRIITVIRIGHRKDVYRNM